MMFFISSQKLSSSTWKRSECDNHNQPEMCVDKPTKWPMNGKRSNFDFHDETETAFNEHINVELDAFYSYLSMVIFFIFK